MQHTGINYGVLRAFSSQLTGVSCLVFDLKIEIPVHVSA